MVVLAGLQEEEKSKLYGYNWMWALEEHRL